MEWVKIHTGRNGQVYLDITPYENTLIFTPILKVGEDQPGVIVLMNRIMKYSIYIKKSDIPILDTRFSRLNIESRILVDKVVIIFLSDYNMINHYTHLADYLYFYRDEIAKQLADERVIMTEKYTELMHCGFKYTIARLHPYHDEIIKLIR
jgi:hypothetical protein